MTFFGFKNINLFNNSSFISLALLNIKQVKVKYLKTRRSSGTSEKVHSEGSNVLPPIRFRKARGRALPAAVGSYLLAGEVPAYASLPLSCRQRPQGLPVIDSRNGDSKTWEDTHKLPAAGPTQLMRERASRDSPTMVDSAAGPGYQPPSFCSLALTTQWSPHSLPNLVHGGKSRDPSLPNALHYFT